ncbi:MAG: hypothetical protein P8M70_06750 [Verrucomicrobiota bacterium]|nr:hypothetical protein [Verrucomicrobiota bacterium]
MHLLRFLACVFSLPFFAAPHAKAAALVIPSPEQIPRVKPGQTPTMQARRMSCWVQDTKEHKPSGKAYVVLTDVQDQASTKAVNKLLAHHKGKLLKLGSLKNLSSDSKAREQLRLQLIKLKPRYVAVVPQLQSYRENMLLALWDVFTRLDADPYLDVYPGLLVASDAASLSGLIERSLSYDAAKQPKNFFGISQIFDPGYKSFQKIEVLKRSLKKAGYSSSNLTINSIPGLENRDGFPAVAAKDHWVLQGSRRSPVSKLPKAARAKLENSSLAMLFGHGVPGRVVGMEVDALNQVNLSNQIILSGCCYSGVGMATDCAMSGPVAGSLDPKLKRFSLVMVDRGAVSVFCHMRLNMGFPHVYPMLESYLANRSLGESYQRLINALIEGQGGFTPQWYTQQTPARSPQSRKMNQLLYMQIGDPALVPIQIQK